MALTNRQIERYSRQIIVDQFGGVAQERLLASHVLLIANNAEAETVLAYLVGAGVGNIHLQANLDLATRDTIIARLRDLNSDSAVVIGDAAADIVDLDLMVAIVSDDATLARTAAASDRRSNLAGQPGMGADQPGFGIVLARLDAPAKLAVIPSRPPCLRCANAGELLAPIRRLADHARFIATLAALEAIKLLAHQAAEPNPALIEFNGYESTRRTLDASAGIACGCGSTRATKAIE